MDSIRYILPVVWLVLSGCQDSPSTDYRNQYDGPSNRCRNDNECAAGVCHRNLSICVKEQSLANRRLSVVYHPNQGPPQTFPLELSQDNTATIYVKRPVTVVPRVRAVGGGKRKLDAHLYILDHHVLKGEAPHIITSAISENEDDPQISLHPDWRRYDVHIDPKDETGAYPPKYFNDLSLVETEEGGVFVSREGFGFQKFNIEQADYEIVGEIQSASQPLDDVRVEAIDAESKRISTSFVTRCLDNDRATICGEFRIMMRRSDMGADPESFEYDLRITRDGDPAYPVITIPSTSGMDIGEGRLRFELPAMPPPLVFKARVEGKVVLRSGARHDGLSDCRLIFESSDEQALTNIEKQVHANTDYMGAIRSMANFSGVLLYPGEYNISILPPSTSPTAPVQYGIFQMTSDIMDPSTGVTFELPFRQNHILQVVFRGDPIPGAAVTATPVSGSAYTPVFEATPQSDGRLSLWMDAGLYVLTIKPPPSSKLAYKLLEYRVSEVADERSLGAPIAIEMGEISPHLPIIATLRLYRGQNPVTGGRIEWFETMGNRTFLIGHSGIDKEGVSLGLLPPPL